jgi:hypothetical protein
MAVLLYICILEMFGLNLDRDIGYRDRCLATFLSSCRHVPLEYSTITAVIILLKINNNFKISVINLDKLSRVCDYRRRMDW